MYLPDQFMRALAGDPVAPGGRQATDERLGRMAAAAGQFARRLARVRGIPGSLPTPGQFRNDLSKEVCCATGGCQQ